MDEFLRKIKITKPENTYKTYRNALLAFFPDGKLNLDFDFLLCAIESWKVSTNTKVLRCAILKTFLNYYRRSHNINRYDDILDLLSIQREEKIPECVTLEQFQVIIHQKMSLRLKTILTLMYENGMRSDEILNLQLMDYDSEENTIIITNPKNHVDRIIYLTDSASQLITDLIHTSKINSNFIFHTDTGNRIANRNLRKEVKNICIKAGFPELHGHSFRHGSAKFLLDHNVNLAKIQSHLGHSSITTTQRYLKIDRKAKEEIKNLFNVIA